MDGGFLLQLTRRSCRAIPMSTRASGKSFVHPHGGRLDGSVAEIAPPNRCGRDTLCLALSDNPHSARSLSIQTEPKTNAMLHVTC